VLKYGSAESFVYVYGPGIAEQIPIVVGERKISMPNVFFSQDWQSCCDPCGNGMSLFRVMYLAGYRCLNDVPKGIILGVLKYVAWCVENPGDVLKTVDDRNRAPSQFLQGTNNAVWASGALELWRTYVDDAI